MKRCKHCNEEKPEQDFPNDKKYPDGKSTWCKACWRARKPKSGFRAPRSEEPKEEVDHDIPETVKVTLVESIPLGVTYKCSTGSPRFAVNQFYKKFGEHPKEVLVWRKMCYIELTEEQITRFKKAGVK